MQIDIDGRMLSLRYPMEVNLVGDSAETLRALMPLLERKTDRSLARDRSSRTSRTGGRSLEARAMNDADPINPQRVFWELSPRLPDDCILAGDSGSSANWYARDLKIRRGMMASLSGTLATMGPACRTRSPRSSRIPTASAIALVGDGAMQMNGINALSRSPSTGRSGATRGWSCWC